MLSFEHCRATSHDITATKIVCTGSGSHLAWQQSIMDHGETPGSYPFLRGFWLVMGFRKEVIVFRFVHNEESTNG